MTAGGSVRRKYNPNLRWYVCGLLFFATTVNYMDRQVLGLLKPVLQREMGWSEASYGNVVMAFQIAYGLMMPLAGRLVDRLGTKVGYALAVAVWSVASMSHALAHTAWQFAAARFGLGLGEAANFPAAVKTVADWFPPKERALATGIFNSGSNLGAIVAPLMVPVLALHFGWRSAFLGTGALDVLWLVVWLSVYRSPESAGEVETRERVPYLRILGKREAWAFLVGKFLTDPVWWFYLFWLPGFLFKNYGLNLTQLGLPLVAIYVSADVGSVLGGWISSPLVGRGWSVTAARKTAMLVCALAVVPVTLVMYTGGRLWLTVGLIALAAAAHQGWSANLFTIPSDTFPKEAVASVVGLGGMAGAAGGALVAFAIGRWLDFSHGAYGPIFVAAGSAYLLALAAIHGLAPRLEYAATRAEGR